MTSARPQLRVVPVAMAPTRADQPEAALRRLFRAEARLQRQLRENRTAIEGERVRYKAKTGLLMLPAIDVLRRTFGQ